MRDYRGFKLRCSIEVESLYRDKQFAENIGRQTREWFLGAQSSLRCSNFYHVLLRAMTLEIPGRHYSRRCRMRKLTTVLLRCTRRRDFPTTRDRHPSFAYRYQLDELINLGDVEWINGLTSFFN